MSEHKVSFAKVPGAGVSSPVIDVPASAPTTGASPEPQDKSSTNAAVANPTSTALAPTGGSALGFYTGEEELPDADPKDVRFPRLNLVQGLSAPELKAVAPDGRFVYKKSVALPEKFKAVIVGVRPKTWIEKLPQGSKNEPRIAKSLEEVARYGGTDQYNLSKWKKDSDDNPVSTIPYFAAHVTFLLLIEQPEGFSADNFAYASEDGKNFGPALFTVKDTSFGSFYIPINSERRGLFKSNFASRYITVGSRKVTAFVPTVNIGDETSPAVRALAAKIVQGN